MATLELAEALVVHDTAQSVDDLVDVHGSLVSKHATVTSLRDPILVNHDALGALKVLFKYKTSKKKEDDDEVLPKVVVDSESEDSLESDEETEISDEELESDED